MGQATRTTKLLLDLGKRTQGGTNTSKRAYLEATVALLNAARAFYVAFFLAHADKLSERVSYFSEKHLEERERALSANELLTWAEFLTVETNEHPDPLRDWNFSRAFPDFPFLYRRAVIKDAIGKVKSYLSNLSNWHHSGKQKGKPGQPGASNHPTLYEGAFSLELDGLDQRESFVRLKIYTGERWAWVNYPVKYSRYFERRRTELGWEQQSPKLVLRPKHAELHCSQVKAVKARKINESKQDPHLVTVAVDLNVKNLAVITARQGGSKSRRMNRKRTNQLRGQINQHAKDKAYAQGTVTVEVNPHGTSQYCSRCGARGERFSSRGGKRIQAKWGKLFRCPVCHYEAHADFNASVNVHRSFYREWHWQPRKKPPPKTAKRSGGGDPLSPATGRGEEACGGTPR